jgi:hypothetical protein
MLHVTWAKRMAAPMIDAVVLLVVAVIALAGCANSTDGQAESSPPAPVQTKLVAPVDREVYDRTAFHSPSGNVGCQISPTSVRCDIDQRDWSPPPRPADCRLDFGQGIAIGLGEPAHFVCAGDTVRVLPPYGGAGEPLAYGEAITAGSMRCESVESGMTCRDVGSGRGFWISREGYRLF